jgi:hypothetical protein
LTADCLERLCRNQGFAGWNGHKKAKKHLKGGFVGIQTVSRRVSQAVQETTTAVENVVKPVTTPVLVDASVISPGS